MASIQGERAIAISPSQQMDAATRSRRITESTPPPVSERRSLAEVAVDIQPQPRTRLQRAMKRSLDVVGSAAGLVVLSPLLATVAVVVRATSTGPALFVQDRVGLGGKVFRFYKFRTMVADAEERKAELAHLNEMSGPVFKIARDPRITWLGGLLRKTSIDELPQLWNVLRGDMSLVGPRPPVFEEVERYTAHQAQRLSVIPGITGLWQVSGRSAISDFDTWLALDLEYVRRQSMWLDLKILARTIGAVLGGRGAQ